LAKVASGDTKASIEQDMKMLSYGIAGEDQIAFELNNSSLPIIVLHDLYLEYDGLSAQIDFLVITTKFNLIIECKNLYGNITVNSSGDFVRETEYNGRRHKEGIYSPITQNARHLELIRRMRLSQRGNFLTRAIFEKYFEDNYRSVVVLANPKTIIDLKYARKEIKNQIIRCDQLVSYIKQMLKESKSENSFESQMYGLADYFLGAHKQNFTDYAKKYKVEKVESINSLQKSASEPAAIPESKPGESLQPAPADRTENAAVSDIGEMVPLENTPIYQALKAYRYETSKAEGIKAFYIFTNAQLEAVIAAMPKSLEDLKRVDGFADVKCQKYGEAILAIVARYS